MLAYNNDPALKVAICAEIQRHQDLDLITTGTYWDGKQGCAVGCSLRSYALATGTKLSGFGNHKLYDDFLGKGGEAIAQLEDTIFERLPRPDHLKFPLRVAQAIRPGADISGVCFRFTAWAMTNPALFPGCVDPAVKGAIDGVADLFLQAAAGGMPTDEKWEAAWNAAVDVAGDAGDAWDAAMAAARAAMTAWTADAALAAAKAADAAMEAAMAAAMADKLLELLEAA